jgi:dCMP deaminase
MLNSSNTNVAPMNRPSWDDYYGALSLVVAQRSPDSQTKHGCIIVDAHHKIVSCGYNGFPKGLKDDQIPNVRPDKYKYIVHAEQNALLNVVVPQNSMAYISGLPCTTCLKLLISAGIYNIIILDRSGHTDPLLDEESRGVIEYINMVTTNKNNHISIKIIQPSFDWVIDAIKSISWMAK